MSTVKISDLTSSGAILGNVIVPVVGNVAGTWTTLKGTVDQLKTFIVASAEANILAANAATIFANTNMKSYVDGQITAANSAVTAANVGIIGYITLANTIQSAQITSANLGIIGYVDNSVSTANLGMKGYVDSVANQSIYGNANVSAYLHTYNYSPYSNVNVAVYTNLSTYAYAANVTAANIGMKGYVDNQTYSNVNVSGFLPSYSGQVGALFNNGNLLVFGNVTAGYALPVISYPNLIFNGTGLANSYAQLNIQNIDSVGTLVSADFIATAPNGSDTSHYIDMGINGNNYSSSSWTVSGANDGYVYINQGNLTLGTDTQGTTVKVHVGGTLAGNVVTTFSQDTVSIGANLVISNTYVPTLANSAGSAGTIVWDNNYVYICVATNTWKRANIATW